MNKHASRDKIRVSVNVIVLREGKVLLGKRANHGKGSWCSPGGHLELGESMIDAVGRELFEETGLKASKIVFHSVFNDTNCDEFHYITINFLAEECLGEPVVMDPGTFSEWKWFPVESLPSPMFSHHEKIIEMYSEGKQFQDYVE